MPTMKIFKKQFEEAIRVLGTESGRVIGQTKNYYFQTDHTRYVFEVEKPTRNSDKLQEILNSFGDSEEIEIGTSLGLVGAKDNQYNSPWACCYIWERARGFSDKGINYFSI